MISFLNRKLRGFLFIILILVAVSFIFFVDFAPTSPMGSNILGKIRGDSINRIEFQTALRETEIAFTLATGQLLSQMSGVEDMVYRETWTRLITLKAAQSAGLAVSDQQVADFITSHPLFQKNGEFEPASFQQFASVFFDPPNVQLREGMNLERFEIMVRNQLMIDQFNELLRAPAVATDAEVDALVQRMFGEARVVPARFSRSQAAKQVKLEEAELRAFYEQNISRYMTPESRRADYVEFLVAAGTPTKGEARSQEMRQLGELAFQFSDPFYQAQQQGSPLPDFNEQAASAGLKVKSSPVITPGTSPNGLPSPKVFLDALQSLSPEAPVSDAIEVDNGYVILKLTDIQAPEPIAFENVRAQVQADYQERETERLLIVEGRRMVEAALREVAQEKPWAEAAKAAGLTVDKPISITPSSVKPDASALDRLAARAAATLDAGAVSPLEATEDGVVVFFVENRVAPLPEIAEAQRRTARQRLTDQKGSMLVRDWVISQYSAPGTSLPISVDGH